MPSSKSCLKIASLENNVKFHFLPQTSIFVAALNKRIKRDENRE